MFAFGMVLAFVLLSSCSLSVEQQAFARTLTLPDLELTNATYVLNKTNEKPMYVDAAEILIYDSTNTARMTDLRFYQKDGHGSIVLEGTAGLATVNLKSQGALLTGTVTVDKPDEQLFVEATHLEYQHEKQLLISVPQTTVVVTYEGNKRVEGSGLRIDLATSSISFEQVIEGVILL